MQIWLIAYDDYVEIGQLFCSQSLVVGEVGCFGVGWVVWGDGNFRPQTDRIW